ncbi:hypothetical protein IS636_003733 [Vibrio cholerae]|nr:hypothetical protein [Vibrio cholerae]
MLSKTKIRILSIVMITFAFSGWFWMTNGLISDYLDILNNSSRVQLSILSLWVPIGFFGALISIVGLGLISLITGKQARLVIDAKWLKLANKICIYSALVGVAFAAGWTYHSIALLEKYGYVYSRNLTEITPTGIHLVYIRAN